MEPREPRETSGSRKTSVPAQETRGGNRVDWAKAEPGQPLPELPPEAYPEPDSRRWEQPPLWDDDAELGGEG